VQYLWGVASSLGLEFNKSRKKFANTVMGHALLEYARNVNNGEKQDMVADKLFKVHVIKTIEFNLLCSQQFHAVHIDFFP